MLPDVLPPYAFVYARDAAAGLLHLLDMPDPPHRVFNVCSGLDWGAALATWCARLADRPGFTWRQTDDPAAVTMPLADTRPRGRLSIGRIAATGWAPRFPARRGVRRLPALAAGGWAAVGGAHSG